MIITKKYIENQLDVFDELIKETEKDARQTPENQTLVTYLKGSRDMGRILIKEINGDFDGLGCK